MQTNKPLTSDYTLKEAPTGTIAFARNRLLTNGYSISENEDGFVNDYTVEGVIVGTCTTTKGVVTISTVNINNVNYFIIALDGVVILRTQYIAWHPTLATEIIYQVNAIDELIVAFWNGVDTYSNKPRLINLTTLPFTVDVNKEIQPETITFNTIPYTINEATCAERTYLFPTFNQSSVTTSVDYQTQGSIIQGRYAFCVKYQTPAGLSQSTIPTTLVDMVDVKFDYTTYHMYQLRGQANVSDKGHAIEAFGKWGIEYNPNQPNDIVTGTIDIAITNMDLKYKLFNLYVIKVTNDGQITVDEISNLTVQPIVNYTYIGVASKYNVDTDGILSEYLTFDKIQTGVVIRNSLYVGNTKKNDTTIYQKYANNIKVGWDFKRDNVGNLIRVNKSSRGLQVCMPNEVYAYNIHLVYKDGTISEGYHIPGRTYLSTELDNLTDSSKYVDVKGAFNAFKEYQLNPNSNTYVPQLTEIANNPNRIPAGTLAYWENENETYYYKEAESYQIWDVSATGVGINTGNTIIATSTKVRHHRMPNIESIYKAAVYKNTVDTAITDVNTDMYPYAIEPVFYDIKIPKEILNDISGYVISYIKKEYTDCIVSAVAPMMRYYPVDVNNGLRDNINTSRIEDDSKAVIFDFSLLNKKPQLKVNTIRVEHQIRSGTDQGGYGATYHSTYPQYPVVGTMYTPVTGTVANPIYYGDVALGNSPGTAGEPVNNMSFGLNFAETSGSAAQTLFTGDIGTTRNVKFIQVEDFEYIQTDNIIQSNKNRAECIKVSVKKNTYLTDNVPISVLDSNIRLDGSGFLTFPQSSIYHRNGFVGSQEMTYDNFSRYTGSYPIHFYQSARRQNRYDVNWGWNVAQAPNSYYYFAISSGNQWNYYDLITYRAYTFAQRYYLVSLLNTISDIHFDYKQQDVILMHNVIPTTTAYVYDTYTTSDDTTLVVTNKMIGDTYYNMYTMLFTDYNYDLEQDELGVQPDPIVSYNRFFIPLKIPSYSRLNPHFRNGEIAAKPDTWIANPNIYNKDSYDASFFKQSNFRVNSIYDDRLFHVTHFYNYLFRSLVSTGENTEIGWNKFTMVSSNNLPTFKIFDNTKSGIIALNTTGKVLYIQFEKTLMLLQYKDTLTTEVVLDERDILEASYEEFIPQNKLGKIGAMFRRCAVLTPMGYMVIDFESRTVHFISDTYSDIGLTYKYNNELYNRLNTAFPYLTGIIDDINDVATIGYDERNERIIFSLKYKEYDAHTQPIDITLNLESVQTKLSVGIVRKTDSTVTTSTEVDVATTLETLVFRAFIYDVIYPTLPTVGTHTSATTSSTGATITTTTVVNTDTGVAYVVTTTVINIYDVLTTYEEVTIDEDSVTTIAIETQCFDKISALAVPTYFTSIDNYLEYLSINAAIGDITIDTLGVDYIYLGYDLVNLVGYCDFLHLVTPFYPIITNVYNFTLTTYYFNHVEKLIKISNPITTVNLTGTIEITPSTYLDGIVGAGTTLLDNALLNLLVEGYKVLGDFYDLSRTEIATGAYTDDPLIVGLYCGTVDTSLDPLINLNYTSWTELSYTFKVLSVVSASYSEYVYIDAYFVRVTDIIKMYVLDVYTERMKYVDGITTVVQDVTWVEALFTTTLNINTETFTTTNIIVETSDYTEVETTVTGTQSLIATLTTLFGLYDLDLGVLSQIELGYTTSEAPLEDVIYVINDLAITVTFTLVDDRYYASILNVEAYEKPILVDNWHTYSFIDKLGIVSKHDYIGNFYIADRIKLRLATTNKIYTQNGNKQYMVNNYNVLAYKPFYVDIVFNFATNNLVIDSVQWFANLFKVLDNANDIEFTKSINGIMVYTDSQCTDLITFAATPNTWFDQTVPRYVKGEFRFDKFRDVVVYSNKAVIDDDGVIFNSSHPVYSGVVNPEIVVNKNAKKWFDKSFIISNFAVVRLYLNANDNDFKNRILQLTNVSLTGTVNNR
jgi:hypothetical protein